LLWVLLLVPPLSAFVQIAGEPRVA
jgi:hypothetical protein